MLRVVLAVVGVTVTMTWPFVNYQGRGQSLYVGDTELIVWTLAWANQALINGWPLFHSNIYFPAPNSLAYNEHLAGLSLFTLPWTLLGASPALAHNLTWACAIPLNLLAPFVWFKSVARSALAAFAGSLAFGVSFYVMLHVAGHLHLIWIWGIPLSLWLLDRWLTRPGLPWLIAWTVVFVLQALTSWYLAVMIGVANLLPGHGTPHGSRQPHEPAFDSHST